MSESVSSSPPRITVVGSANIDLVARCERLPRPRETVTDAVFEPIPGGKGANQVLAAARLGARWRSSGTWVATMWRFDPCSASGSTSVALSVIRARVGSR